VGAGVREDWTLNLLARARGVAIPQRGTTPPRSNVIKALRPNHGGQTAYSEFAL
jgi:hypothetical protein